MLTTCGNDPDAPPSGPMEPLQTTSHQSLRVPFVGGIDPTFGLVPAPPCSQLGTRLGTSPTGGAIGGTGGTLFSSQISRSTGASGEYSLFGSTPTTTSGP